MKLFYNKSFKGYSHTQSNKPCQDYSDSYVSGDRIIVTCADGHGGNIYFRSELGSKFASDSLIKVLSKQTLKKLKNIDKIKLDILCEWNSLVEQDIEKNPINIDELDFLNDKEKKRLIDRLSAEQGDARAQCNLGVCYRYGTGVEKDEEEAVRLYRLAAEQGDACAQCNLGYCYDEGIWVEKDEEEAVKWYRLSAEQGYARGQCNLGYCYENGTGVNKDENEAAIWYKLAADQGYARAEGHLGHMHLYGKGVQKNIIKAKEYFTNLNKNDNKYIAAIEMCDRRLGVKDNKNYSREFVDTLNDNNYYEEINRKLNMIFNGLPRALESKTFIFVKSGVFSYYNFYKLQKEKKEKLDYTSCIGLKMIKKRVISLINKYKTIIVYAIFI